jgi:hypothetical protein
MCSVYNVLRIDRIRWVPWIHSILPFKWLHSSKTHASWQRVLECLECVLYRMCSVQNVFYCFTALLLYCFTALLLYCFTWLGQDARVLEWNWLNVFNVFYLYGTHSRLQPARAIHSIRWKQLTYVGHIQSSSELHTYVDWFELDVLTTSRRIQLSFNWFERIAHSIV